MNVIGFSSYGKESSAACLVQDGKVIAAAFESSFSRKQKDSDFPERAIEFCLQKAKLNSSEIDYFVFYEKPFLKFDRVLTDHFLKWPMTFREFLELQPLWLGKKFRLSSNVRKSYPQSGPLFFCQRHEALAAAAFYASPYESAAIVTIDDTAEQSGIVVHAGKDKIISALEEMPLAALATSNAKVLSDLIKKVCDQARQLSGENQLCLVTSDKAILKVGEKLKDQGDLTDAFIFPLTGGAPAVVGSALSVYFRKSDAPRLVEKIDDFFWGPEFSQTEINEYLTRAGIPHEVFSEEKLKALVFELLKQKKTVAKFQGPLEFNEDSLEKRIGLPGGPMACTPQNAFQCFAEMKMDYLVLGHALIKREQIPYLL
jgi:predicted NodU family carbamoyl transferase